MNKCDTEAAGADGLDEGLARVIAESDTVPHVAKVDDNGSEVTVFLEGQILDEDLIQKLGRWLTQMDQATPHRMVKLDLSAVSFLTAAALGKLITLNDSRQEQRGEQLILTGVREEIREVFTLTKLDQIITVAGDKEPSSETVSSL